MALIFPFLCVSLLQHHFFATLIQCAIPHFCLSRFCSHFALRIYVNLLALCYLSFVAAISFGGCSFFASTMFERLCTYLDKIGIGGMQFYYARDLEVVMVQVSVEIIM